MLLKKIVRLWRHIEILLRQPTLRLHAAAACNKAALMDGRPIDARWRGRA